MSVAMATESIKFETAPVDPRFPNQNQTRYGNRYDLFIHNYSFDI